MITKKEIAIFDSTAHSSAAFTAATSDVITSAAHGLSNGDRLQLTTTTTLPAGLAVTTDYFVISATTDTFEVAATKGGTKINITDTGTGTHTWHEELQGYVNVASVQFITIAFNTAASANATVQFAGSITDLVPTFESVQSITNRYDFLDIIDLEDGASIDGDTGIAPSGTDDQRLVQVNVEGIEWFAVRTSAFIAGTLFVGIKGFNYNS